ncbi:MAG: aminotransferase, partial [Pseudomonadota bacterium]
MYIKPFKVEIWMNDGETKCSHNLAETCVASITIDELLRLSGVGTDELLRLLAMKMTYGEIKGSLRLRKAVASLYDNQAIENITITHGTIAANMLLYKAMMSRGDHMVSVVPTYQQHHSIPESIGADVELFHLIEEEEFLPNLDRLQAAVKPSTKLIALTNPNNPTGALIERSVLEGIAEIARSVGAYVLCDEVYRGTNQRTNDLSPSMADIYKKGISTASTSKAFSLAGLRVGWLIAPREITEDVLIHRDYDTISVGMINEHFAALALENHDKILARSREITRKNLAVVAEWIEEQPRVSWVKPSAGTTAMLKLDVPVTSREFCTDLLARTGVLLTPGEAFDMDGYVRIGFANDPTVLRAGLNLLSDYMKRFE